MSGKLNHRKFLKNHVAYKEVIPLSPELAEFVHTSFRLQYMKDVALPRVLDEATFATLNSLIYYNNLKIVTEIKRDEELLTQLHVFVSAYVCVLA